MLYLSPSRDEYYKIAAGNSLALNQRIQEEQVVTYFNKEIIYSIRLVPGSSPGQPILYRISKFYISALSFLFVYYMDDPICKDHDWEFLDRLSPSKRRNIINGSILLFLFLEPRDP